MCAVRDFKARYVFMFNQPAWQHVTCLSRHQKYATAPRLAFQPQTVLVESLPLHTVLNAPDFSILQPRRWSNTPRKDVRGSVVLFFWPGRPCRLVHWVTSLGGLCCHLVYISTSHHATVWQQKKADLHCIQKGRAQTQLHPQSLVFVKNYHVHGSRNSSWNTKLRRTF